MHGEGLHSSSTDALESCLSAVYSPLPLRNMLIDLGPLGQQNSIATLLLGVGALSLASVLYTLTKFFLSTFVVPGKSVCCSTGSLQRANS